jgi:hypothetical protein
MTGTKIDMTHPSDIEISDYLSGCLENTRHNYVRDHLAICGDCLGKAVISFESVKEFRSNTSGKNRKAGFMKKINIYLILAIISFMLSFITPKYFLQLLVATLVLGAKWVVDSKTTKLLVTVHEALKRGDDKEAARILEPLDRHNNARF